LSETTALNSRSVLVAGVGNIGSHLAPLLARAGFGRITLVDRDHVEEKNLTAQDYTPEDVGKPKARVQAERLAKKFPHLNITAWVGDLEDMPLGLARCDLVLGALDSRRARQVLHSEISWPLGVPVIDGGVGDGGLGRVQVFRPGSEGACLECTWGKADYRLLAAEYPCLPGAAPGAPPTGAPAFLGSFTASLMASEAVRLLNPEGGSTPQESYEVVFDLNNLHLRRFGLRRASRCRYDHVVLSERRAVRSTVTFLDIFTLLEANFGTQPVSVECRRGLGGGAMTGGCHLDRETLQARGNANLLESGFVIGDHLRVRSEGRQWFLEITAEG
jgi:hypothetical protein